MDGDHIVYLILGALIATIVALLSYVQHDYDTNIKPRKVACEAAGYVWTSQECVMRAPPGWEKT